MLFLLNSFMPCRCLPFSQTSSLQDSSPHASFCINFWCHSNPQSHDRNCKPWAPPALTHTNPIFQVDPLASPFQLFFSSVSVAAVTPTPSLSTCPTTGSQDGTARHHFTRRKEHAEKLKGCAEKQLTLSHSPPRKLPTHTQNLALRWPASPSEMASSTTETQHCPQMCREQTPRGPNVCL